MSALGDLLARRFGTSAPEPPEQLAENPELLGIANHRSIRRFTSEQVPEDVLATLFGCAFSSPAKSDLQQSCVVRVTEDSKRAALAALVPSMPWIADAPELLVFCGDNRRIRRICELRGTEFGNDHLDSFFNAAVDTALAMMSFIRAAEAAGLGCCPISALRNQAPETGRLLELPPHVFPVAGLVMGVPDQKRSIAPRLPLRCFVHTDHYDDEQLPQLVDAYDRRRHAALPLAQDRQRLAERYGSADFYGWSEDKARQVAQTERETFGEYIRAQKFRLD